jgi:hypothetical protein
MRYIPREIPKTLLVGKAREVEMHAHCAWAPIRPVEPLLLSVQLSTRRRPSTAPFLWLVLVGVPLSHTGAEWYKLASHA